MILSKNSFHEGRKGLDRTMEITDGIMRILLILIEVLRSREIPHRLKKLKSLIDCNSFFLINYNPEYQEKSDFLTLNEVFQKFR